MGNKTHDSKVIVLPYVIDDAWFGEIVSLAYVNIYSIFKPMSFSFILVNGTFVNAY